MWRSALDGARLPGLERRRPRNRSPDDRALPLRRGALRPLSRALQHGRPHLRRRGADPRQGGAGGRHGPRPGRR
ncbi:hypothetical protein CNY89_12460, partial [Amaricoccus sp. HAR-UPW-R2A-40]